MKEVLHIMYQIAGNPFSLPKTANVPPPTQMDKFLNHDQSVVPNYELVPTVLVDIEKNFGLVVGQDVMYFPPDKDYHGGITGVRQPAYLLIKNNSQNGQITASTNKFIITQWQETHTERVQILETFHSSTINWFDERTKTYAFAGVFLEGERSIPLLTKDSEEVKHTYLWGQSFRKLWDEKLRGTKLVENNEICIMTIMNNVLYGYPFALVLNSNSAMDNSIQFQFQFICVKHLILGNKLDESYSPIQNQNRLFQTTDPGLLQVYINARKELEKLSTATPPDYYAISQSERKLQQALDNLMAGSATGEDFTSSWLDLLKVDV